MKYEEMTHKIYKYLNGSINTEDAACFIDWLLDAIYFKDGKELKEAIIYQVLNWFSKDYIEDNEKEKIAKDIVDKLDN